MTIEWTVSLGNLLTIAAGFITVVGFFITLRADLTAMSRRLSVLEDNSREQTHILVALAEQKTHIDALAKRIDDIHRYGSHRLAEIIDHAMGHRRNPGD